MGGVESSEGRGIENSDQSGRLQASPSSDSRDSEGTRQDQPQKLLVASPKSTLAQASRRG